MRRRNVLNICIIAVLSLTFLLIIFAVLYIIGHMDYLLSEYEKQNVNTDIVPMINSGLKKFLIGLMIMFILIGYLLLFFIHKFLINPINELSQATKEIIEGNLDFEIRKTRNDEIGQLQSDFEELRKHLKETTSKLSKNAENARNMMSNISHDLKTPLTAIKGYSEGILDGVADTVEMKNKYVRTIYTKACLMEELVEDLSYFSKLDNSELSYTFKLIPIKEFLEDCVSELETDMSFNEIVLTKEFPEGDDENIILDPFEIRRVIMNIIGNSMKYMDKSEGKIDIKLSFDEKFAWISVRDNGRGISENDLEHIFERFFRADQSRGTRKGGTGLGLSIAQSIVVDHGGTIKAESELGVFTEISFSLPRGKKKVQA